MKKSLKELESYATVLISNEEKQAVVGGYVAPINNQDDPVISILPGQQVIQESFSNAWKYPALQDTTPKPKILPSSLNNIEIYC